MDPVEEECQARRAEERTQRYVVPVLLQNIPPAPVWNRGRGRGRGRFQPTPVHVPQNLEDAILDLRRRQHNEQQQLQIIGGGTSTLHHLHLLSMEQQQRTTQEYRAQIMRVEAERQRWVEERQIEQQRLVGQLEALQAERRTEPSQIVQINQIMERWRDEDANALDYEEQQNRDGNGDLYVNRNMQENILRVVSNIFHSFSVNEY